MRTLLDDDSFDFRFEVGISDLSSKLHLSDRFHLLQSLSTHFTIVQVKAQIDQLIEGLGAIGVYDLMKCNPHIMKRLFTSNPKPLTADFMIDLFQSRFSPECSNRREDEEQIWMYWVNFIERIDGKSYIKPRVYIRS